MKLRDYQIPVVKAVSQCFIENQTRVIMQMPTGAGKTASAAYIVDKHDATARQVLWLVHRNELLYQAAMTFAEIGVKHRLIASAQAERQVKVGQFKEYGRSYIDENAHVVLCSIQTLVRRLDKTPWFDPYLIIADECHLSLNNTFRSIIGRFPEARLIGLTATPDRSDGQSFDINHGGLYDTLVHGPQTYELMDVGNLASYEIFKPPIPLDDIKKRTKGGDWNPEDLEAEFKNEVVFGSVVEHYKKYAHKLPAIGFCPTIKIAQAFTEKFRDAGYNFHFLDGNTPGKERFDMLQDLAKGNIDGVMSVGILIEGTDIPLATVGLMLTRTKSIRVYLQSIGRLLRPHPKKQRAVIMDFVGLTEIHGYPDDHREWSLSGKPKSRPREAKEIDETTIKVQTCPTCYRAHRPADLCPHCGHVYSSDPKERQILEVQGELIRVTREERELEHQKKQEAVKERRLEEGACQTYEDWLELAKSRGYKFPAQWAKRRYQLRVKRKQA